MHHAHYVHILYILQLEHAMVCSYSDKLQTNIHDDAEKSNFQNYIFKNKTGSKILVIFIATHYRDKHLYLECM